MERSYANYQSLPDANVVFGGDSGQGHEHPGSVMIINVTATPMDFIYGKPIGEPIDLSIALTVPQMAQIVMNWFWEIGRRGIYRNFLVRLMRKRWAVMTSSVYKRPTLDPDGSKKMDYASGIQEAV